MKNYLMTFVIWIVLALAFTFFFAGMVLSAGVYFVAVLIALAGAIITCGFERQGERIEALKARLEALEKKEESNGGADNGR